MKRKAKPKDDDAKATLQGMRIRVGLLTKQLALVRANLDEAQQSAQARHDEIEALKQRVRDEAAGRRKLMQRAGGSDELAEARAERDAAMHRVEEIGLENASLRAQLVDELKKAQRLAIDERAEAVRRIKQRTLLRVMQDRIDHVDEKYATAVALLVDSRVEIDDDMKAALDELDEG